MFQQASRYSPAKSVHIHIHIKVKGARWIWPLCTISVFRIHNRRSTSPCKWPRAASGTCEFCSSRSSVPLSLNSEGNRRLPQVSHQVCRERGFSLAVCNFATTSPLIEKQVDQLRSLLLMIVPQGVWILPSRRLCDSDPYRCHRAREFIDIEVGS
jgi:hypothetical protein